MKSLICILLIFAFAISSCSNLKQPEFRRLENFGVKNVSLQEAIVGFQLTYYNPNDFKLGVKEADIDLYIDTVYIGKFTQPQAIDVLGTAEFSIPLEGRLSWNKIIQSKLHRQAGKEVPVRASGKVKVGKAGVFVNRDIEYTGRHTLDLDLLKNPALGTGF